MARQYNPKFDIDCKLLKIFWLSGVLKRHTRPQVRESHLDYRIGCCSALQSKFQFLHRTKYQSVEKHIAVGWIFQDGEQKMLGTLVKNIRKVSTFKSIVCLVRAQGSFSYNKASGKNIHLIQTWILDFWRQRPMSACACFLSQSTRLVTADTEYLPKISRRRCSCTVIWSIGT